MPRTKIGIPPEQWELEKELQTKYGRFMTMTEIGFEIKKSRPTVRKWVDGLTVHGFDRKTKLFAVKDVAKKIYESRWL